MCIWLIGFDCMYIGSEWLVWLVSSIAIAIAIAIAIDMIGYIKCN